MSNNNYTAELLGMEGVNVLNVINTNEHITVELERQRKPHVCPSCNSITESIHDYRLQKVKDIAFQGKPVIWHLRKRRYRCTCCGKRFYEKNYLLPKHHRITNRTAMLALVKLGERRSQKSVAKEMNVSESTIGRWMKCVNYAKPKLLPKVLSIDEFKGNTDTGKFQCILTDVVNKRIFDILPTRDQSTLYNYFRNFANKDKVQFVVMDMSKPFYFMAKQLFPNATIVIDKFHVARYCTWGFENVRVRIQSELLDEDRKYFKRSRKLLLCRSGKLRGNGADKIAVMLSYSSELANAYYLKEQFYKFMDSKDSVEAKERLKEFMFHSEVFNIKEFRALMSVLRNWTKHILAAFDSGYTNGFTEGMNNAIKVLKRIGFGYKSFENFRRRILHIDRQKQVVSNK